jgi:hypothetical protein
MSSTSSSDDSYDTESTDISNDLFDMKLSSNSTILNEQIRKLIEASDMSQSMQQYINRIRKLSTGKSIDNSDANGIPLSQNDAPEMILIVHHQCPGIELVSPVYSSIFTECYLPPDQILGVGSTTQIGFNIDPQLIWSTGTLMYKLQRKNFDQSNEDEATCIQLVMIWKISKSKFYADSLIIEHDKSHVWDRNKLIKMALTYELVNMQDVPIEGTYLMHDNTVLMTKMDATYEKGYYRWEITVSEASIEDNTLRLQYIDVDW